MIQRELDDIQKGDSLGQAAWRRLRQNKLAMFGLGVIVLFSILSFLAPVLAPFPYDEQNLALGPTPPSWTHWFGTDTLGRDLFTRSLYGGRISLTVGLLATLVSLTIGVSYGAIAGYVGGRVDMIMTRFIDALYAVPFTIFVIILMAVFGRNFILIFVAIGAVEWLTMARIVRGQVKSLSESEFVMAAIALGLRKRRIIFRHIVPNVLGVIVVYATLTVPKVILLEAFLSFLGLGAPPPMSSWGTLIGNGAEVMEEYPWLLFFPGLIFSLTLFSLNFLGDGLRDALDPKMAKD